MAGFEGSVRADQELFAADCTVVLLSGLAGDLETDNQYRRELGAWLDLISKNTQVRKVFVFADNPEGLTLPSGVQGSLSKSDRKGFLALAEGLSATAPTTFIVWGHGGKQGNQSVFHVRGPRITPADCETVSSKVTDAEMRWVLLFRGSGTFAEKLAGNAAVLASEHESMSSNDPIGMGLLLKSARENPSTSFPELARLFGAAVRDWYAERNLVRMEEPTLWRRKAGPELLAVDQAEAPVPQISSNQVKAAAQPRPAAETNLPPAWKEIQRIDPSAYPNSEAVILQRRLKDTLGKSPALVREQEEFIQILTAEGLHYGDFDVSYSPPMEEIEFFDCEVLTPTGHLLRLDPDEIRDARDPSVAAESPTRHKTFSLPGVVPGALLRVRYRTQWQKFPLPYFSFEIPIAHDLPVVAMTIETSVAKNSTFHFETEGIKAADPEVRQTPYGSTYVWRFQKVPPLPREPLVPPGGSHLLISTFPDWRSFADWYGRICQLSDEVTPEIANKAAELTEGIKSDREKVEAVYNYVTRMRYVAVPLGINSYRPHAAAGVLQNQYGDCKDKANLFNTLLKSLHLESHLVLVPRFKQAHEGVPGLAFNHAISQVVLDGQKIWVDTTDDNCRFGMLPPGDGGRKVVVIDGKTEGLTPLPAAEPGEHGLKLSGELNCGTSNAISARLKLETKGYVDYVLRGAAAKAGASSVPLPASQFRSCAGSFALEKQKQTPASALDQNFIWEAEGQYFGLRTQLGGKGTLHAPFWIPREWDLALHRREMPVFLNHGYPLRLEQEFQFVMPRQTRVLALPAPTESKAAPLRWSLEWTNMGNDRLSARFRAELAAAELSEAETILFQQQLQELLEALAAGAALAPL